MRVLNGQVIYRDFFKFLPPGSIYLMALVYWLFGQTVSVTVAKERGKMHYDFFEEVELHNGGLFIYSRKVSIYFYLRLLPPTPYDDLLPGHNTKKQLPDAVSYLEKNKPGYVLNDNMVDDIIKDKESMSYPMADIDDFINDPVNAYLKENYEPVPVGTAFDIFKRKRLNGK